MDFWDSKEAKVEYYLAVAMKFLFDEGILTKPMHEAAILAINSDNDDGLNRLKFLLKDALSEYKPHPWGIDVICMSSERPIDVKRHYLLVKLNGGYIPVHVENSCPLHQISFIHYVICQITNKSYEALVRGNYYQSSHCDIITVYCLEFIKQIIEKKSVDELSYCFRRFLCYIIFQFCDKMIMFCQNQIKNLTESFENLLDPKGVTLLSEGLAKFSIWVTPWVEQQMIGITGSSTQFKKIIDALNQTLTVKETITKASLPYSRYEISIKDILLATILFTPQKDDFLESKEFILCRWNTGTYSKGYGFIQRANSNYLPSLYHIEFILDQYQKFNMDNNRITIHDRSPILLVSTDIPAGDYFVTQQSVNYYENLKNNVVRCFRCKQTKRKNCDPMLPMIYWMSQEYQQKINNIDNNYCIREAIEAAPVIHYECFEDFKILTQCVKENYPEEKKEDDVFVRYDPMRLSALSLNLAPAINPTRLFVDDSNQTSDMSVEQIEWYNAEIIKRHDNVFSQYYNPMFGPCQCAKCI
jgi:hypothetical protein